MNYTNWNYDPNWQEKFDEEHGQGEPPVKIGDKLHFADGAVRGAGLDITCFVPSNARQRLELIVKFRKRKLEIAVQAFDAYKLRVANDPSAWAREDEHLAQLKALKAIVKDCQTKHDAVQAELEALVYGTPEQREHNAMVQAETDARRQHFLNKVRKLDNV